MRHRRHTACQAPQQDAIRVRRPGPPSHRHTGKTSTAPFSSTSFPKRRPVRPSASDRYDTLPLSMSTTGSKKSADPTYKYSRYFTYKIHSTPNVDWINAIFRIMILRYAPYDNHHYFELLCIEIETWIFIFSNQLIQISRSIFETIHGVFVFNTLYINTLQIHIASRPLRARSRYIVKIVFDTLRYISELSPFFSFHYENIFYDVSHRRSSVSRFQGKPGFGRTASYVQIPLPWNFFYFGYDT